MQQYAMYLLSWHNGQSKDDKKINKQQYAAYSLGIME